MKKKLLCLALTLIGGVAIAQNKSLKESLVIDQHDTVVLNVAQAVTQSGYVEFPVFYRSDDTINALDFSLRFNTTKFAYDSVIRLAGYLTMSANYNTSDSTLYFTSYSLQWITRDTPLVKVRFHVLSGLLCGDDLSSVAVYLNGYSCTAKVTYPVSCITAVGQIENKNLSPTLYPNPTNGLSNLKFYSALNESTILSIYDLTGRIVKEENLKLLSGEYNYPINLNNLSNGIYILKLKSSQGDSAIRLVKQ